MVNTTTEDFFETKYRENPDPWSFARSEYELQRYDRILSALHARRYDLAFEPGCSVGVLTQRLALFCARVESADISETAVQKAKARCADLPNVTIHKADLRDFVPENADLYVFSEVGYYMTREELFRVVEQHTEALRAGATVLACHWRGVSADHLLHGDAVHEVLHGIRGLKHEFAEVHDRFRLDRWVKQGAGK